ncbi:hypothetical protein PGQ11_002975 [Apiospora arundinis]|uniref:HTH OST-type domain-containing protein n=1 Tax=Apiospora arundinis TaxID=335852 RepID=A0ABR2J3T1_9PEZI
MTLLSDFSIVLGNGSSESAPSPESVRKQPDSTDARIAHGVSKYFALTNLIGNARDDDALPGLREEFDTQQLETFMNTPIFASGVDEFMQSQRGVDAPELIPQYGLIGIQQDVPGILPQDKLIVANMNIPWSAFICGSQGAGKSHTLSCLLESYIDQNSGTGKLPNPLAGMVMHYDNFTNNTTTQLCEAAYLCSSGIPVNVLVCPSHIWTMKRLYTNLPSVEPKSLCPKVMPLYLTESQLNISRILKLMAVDPTTSNMPLYMEVVTNITRQMAMEGPDFTYTEFRRRLEEVKWVKGQDGPLQMRLQLLDTFLAPSPLTKTTKPAQAEADIWKFAPGSLTIVDLSDPFLSSDDACALFSICLSIFMEDRCTCGRVVALDEAHKFLVQSGEARVLTGELTSIIRQQRHTGTRVIIATQEPTLAPELIDLANATFVHRFLSPAWYKTLKGHLAGADKSEHSKALFETIVTLKTGQALLFCPTAQLEIVSSCAGSMRLKALGDRYTKLTIRKRTTMDGGRSITALEPSGYTETWRVEVPMHIVPANNKVVRFDSTTTPNTCMKSEIRNTPKDASPGPVTAQSSRSEAGLVTNTHTETGVLDNRDKVREALQIAIHAASGKKKWASIARVGQLVTEQHSGFDPRAYGHTKLSDLINDMPAFEVTERSPKMGKPAVPYVRLRKIG